MNMLGGPHYWQNESTGSLRRAITAYLNGHHMSEAQIADMRAYLRQWIMAPVWLGEAANALRARIDDLTTRKAIRDWLADAAEEEIDPL
jgi:hypothetical protein